MLRREGGDEISLWDDIGDAISGAADAVGGVVEDVVNAVEEVVTDVVESIGDAISDGLGAIGDFLGRIPGVGGVLRGFFHWLGDIISGLTDLVGAVIKGLLGVIGGVVAGLIRVVFGGIGGLLSWDGRVFMKGLKGIAASIVGAVLVILGKLVGLVQSVFFLQWGKRPLTENEKEILRRVFRRSVALYNVRIIRGFAGLFSINPRPFTLGNTIYLKNHDPATEPELLVHECTHVWQYQNRGTRYTADALGAQAFVDDAYNWELELARGETRWQDFNAEAEAEFLEDVYKQGSVIGSPATGNGEFYNDSPVGANVEFIVGPTDHTTLAKDSVAYVRGAFAWRLSGLF